MINVNRMIKIKQPNHPETTSWLDQIAAVAETAHISRNRAAAEIIANLLYDLVDRFQTETHDDTPNADDSFYGHRIMNVAPAAVTHRFD